MIRAVIQRNKLVVTPKRQEIVVRHPLRGVRGELGGEVDGGAPDAVYLTEQILDGGTV